MRTCSICVHPKRLLIDKALIGGQSLASIGRQFGGLSRDALANHRSNHLTQRLLTLTARRELAESLDLKGEIEALIGRVKGVLDYAETHRQHEILLKASTELRGSFELLLKIAVALYDAEKDQRAEAQEAAAREQEDAYAASLSILTTAELAMLEAIGDKLESRDRRKIVIPDASNMFRTAEPVRKMRRLSYPDGRVVSP